MSLRLAATFGFVGLLCFCYGVNAKLKGDDCEGKLTPHTVIENLLLSTVH